MKEVLKVPAALGGTRLDKAVGELSRSLSRSAARELIIAGGVQVEGKPVESPKAKVTAGDEIRLEIPEKEEQVLKAEEIPLDIVYEDGDLAVIRKPAGMLVHPAPGEMTGTLANAVLWHYGDRIPGGGGMRPGIVHRLDRDTSGVMVIAKSERAFRSLTEQMKHRRAVRKYIAVVCGNLKEEEGRIDVPIGRDPARRSYRRAEGAAAREAVTDYRVLRRFAGYDLAEAELVTGRTHQIRVHFAWLGHPVAGDPIYKRNNDDLYIIDGAGNRTPAGRQLLQSGEIGFTHPGTGDFVTFRIEPDDEIKKAIEKLKPESSEETENV